jgi:hypothetical protein
VGAEAYRGKILADPSCRACGRAGSEAHHLVRRGNPWLGEDVPENVVCLCLLCHDAFHRHRDWARVGRMIGENLEPDEVWYIIEKAGAGYAARYYGIGEE